MPLAVQLLPLAVQLLPLPTSSPAPTALRGVGDLRAVTRMGMPLAVWMVAPVAMPTCRHHHQKYKAYNHQGYNAYQADQGYNTLRQTREKTVCQIFRPTAN